MSDTITQPKAKSGVVLFIFYFSVVAVFLPSTIPTFHIHPFTTSEYFTT